MKIKNRAGMTLFIAVVIMGILLFISFAVVNITIKGTLFASSGRDSQYAFYAADAGLECALYWDSKFDTSKFDPSTDGSPISCGGDTDIRSNDIISGTTTLTQIGGGGGTESTITKFNYYSNYSGRAFKILLLDGNIVKYKSDLITPASTGIGSYIPNPPISYSNGWSIGVWFGGDGANIPFDLNGTTFFFSSNGSGEPSTGGSISWAGSDSRTYSVNGEHNGTIVVGNSSVPRSNIDGYLNFVIKDTNKNAVGNGGSTNPISNFGFSLNSATNPSNACAIVTVTKDSGTTHIYSRGYNTCDTSNPRRVERGVEVTY